MKKFFFLAALAASMGIMTSCSEDDLMSSSLGVDSNTIAFATQPTGKAMTRSGVSINSIDLFTVSAVNDDGVAYFNNEKFVFDESYGVFKSSAPHYWPADGKLSFYAINYPGVHSVGDNNSPRYTYNRWDAEEDLVSATVLSGEKQIPYPLNFKHLTSQIYVGAEAENKVENLTYKLISVKLITPSKGTYSFASQTGGVGSWEIDNSSTTEYSYDEALPLTFMKNGQIELSSLYWNILPASDANVMFKVEYQVIQSGRVISDNTGVKAKTCVIESPNFQPGMRYHYNFVLGISTNDEITFTMTMNDWDETSLIDTYPATLPNSFELNHTTLKIAEGQTSTLGMLSVIPADASKTLKFSSDHPEIAAITEDGVVTGVSVGNCIITATTPNGLVKTCAITVVEGDPFNEHEYVDLGLPSGILWAKYNVGSTDEKDPGLLFYWGDTKGYTAETLPPSNTYTFDWTPNTYLNLEHDAARVNMGGKWRLPSNYESEELINATENHLTVIDGQEGYLFTSKTNGNTLFIPCISFSEQRCRGGFWTSYCTYVNAYSLDFNRDDVFPDGRIYVFQSPYTCPMNVRGIIKL